MSKGYSRKNPVYQQGFNAGKREAMEFIHKYLNERIESLIDVPGIGRKTVEKVFDHIESGMRD